MVHNKLKENNMVASRYECYFLVVKNKILLAELAPKILFLPLENKNSHLCSAV